MAKYNVKLVREDWFYMEVEADNEDEAFEKAHDEAPYLSAQDSGWGQSWSVDAGDWQTPEEHYGSKYEVDFHGRGIEEVKDDDA
jgi:hypothetical protein